MEFDLIFRRGRIAGREDQLVDLGVRSGRFAAVETSMAGTGPEVDLGGRLVVPGFVETHVHLDKSGIMDRCTCVRGTLEEAVASVAAAKRQFDEADVYERGAGHAREGAAAGDDPDAPPMWRSIRASASPACAPCAGSSGDYAWAIDIELCAFPQEGLLDDPGCDAVLVEALEAGCEVVGGAPYMDRDPHGQIARIFDLARQFDRDIDLHLDFTLDTTQLDVDEVCRKTDASKWGGRVTVGHVTKLSALEPERLGAVADRMRSAGVAATVLPATDLYLIGRDRTHNVPRGVAPAHVLLDRGVTCSLSTNNVLNPFTPFGDCSLIRMANLYANVAQIGSPSGLANLPRHGHRPIGPADEPHRLRAEHRHGGRSRRAGLRLAGRCGRRPGGAAGGLQARATDVHADPAAARTPRVTARARSFNPHRTFATRRLSSFDPAGRCLPGACLRPPWR